MDRKYLHRELVELRPVSADDVDDILSWVNDPEVVGNLAAFSGKPLTRDDELAWIERVSSSETERVFSVLASDDGRYLGQVGINQIFWRSKVGRLSVVIARRGEMGRGFGSAAIARVLDVAFGELGLHKMWLMVFEHNERSLRTYTRLGFQREGVLREEYFHEEDWHNMVRMSLLDREWSTPDDG
jgi:RimJ/RimL family protein N-acetyltransferase